MYDKLIDIVKEYIDKMGVDSFKTFSMSYNCSKVLLSERDFKFHYKYKKKMDFKKNDALVEGFLSDLNPSYLEHYRLRKSDGSFIFEDDESGYGYSTYNDDGKPEIYVGLTGSIEDGFSIVHELFHDINATGEFDSYGRYFFTKPFIMTSHFLSYDRVIILSMSKKIKVFPQTDTFAPRSKPRRVRLGAAGSVSRLTAELFHR